jgi:hypothetical protein
MIDANYLGTWTLDQKKAFDSAEAALAALLPTSYAGETIAVDVQWQALTGTGGLPDTNTLGMSSPTFWYKNFGSTMPWYRTDTWYPTSLASYLGRHDLTSGAEMSIVFNSNFADWYYGLDSNTGGLVDFMSIAMHELTHGLGFLTTVQSDGSFAFGGPSIWEWYAEGDNGHGETQPFAELDAVERLNAIAVGDITWGGEYGLVGNGGLPIDIYSPSGWEPGSSLSHLDPTQFPNALMRPYYYTAPGVAFPAHSLSGVERGLLADIGWRVPEPPTMLLLLLGALVARSFSRRELRQA